MGVQLAFSVELANFKPQLLFDLCDSFDDLGRQQQEVVCSVFSMDVSQFRMQEEAAHYLQKLDEVRCI